VKGGKSEKEKWRKGEVEKWRKGEREKWRGFAWQVKPSLCPLNK